MFQDFSCLYPINVKTAEPIRPKFIVGPHITPRKFYKCVKFVVIVSSRRKCCKSKIEHQFNLKQKRNEV